MKKPTFIFALLILCILVTSCQSTYYYSTIDSSSQNIFKADNGEFIVENDSLYITYSFNGINAPVKVSIYNKSDIPFYVDWNKSAVIINDVATSYKGDKVSISGFSDGSGYVSSADLGYVSVSGSFSGSATLPQGLTFIPPRSKINHQSLKLKLFNYDKIDKSKYSNYDIKNKYNWRTNIKAINYTEAESPLHFRSYLTLYDQNGRVFITEQDFYLSNLIKTRGEGPDRMPSELVDRGDVFHIEKLNTTGGTIAGGVIITGIIVGGVAASIREDSKATY